MANYLRVADVNVSNAFIQPGACANVSRATNIVLQNVSGAYMATGNVDHVGILGGSWGGTQGTPVQMADCGLGGAHRTAFVRFDGVNFHDAIEVGTGAHLECLQSFTGGTEHAIIRNSKFTNCAQWDISGDFLFSLLVENNQMSEPCSGQSQPPCKGGIRAPISLKCADAGNVTVRFNSMRGGLIFFEACSLKGTNRFYGNATDWPISQSECDGLTSNGFQFSYNVFGSGGVACGQNAVVAGNQWVNAAHSTYNFHLLSCSVASANFVPTSVAGGYPATDYAGVARPKGAKLDAGAYEDCS